MAKIVLKRVYEAYSESDGYRVLVDRLWPRGIKKEKAHLDLWMKEIAPTNELRKWFNHEAEKWDTFSEKYKKEITNNKEATQKLLAVLKSQKKITFLYGAKDEVHNQAVVLKEWMEGHQ